jgi:NADPH:quinone reductase-like Zn-dependent oxidoreductase
MNTTKQSPKAPSSLAMHTMQAILYIRYGSPNVLQLAEVERPVPKDNEVLMRVHAASLNAYDRVVRGRPLLIRVLARNGLRRPNDRHLGVILAGRVEAVGGAVTRFQVGDAVYGSARGAFAEYACAREDQLAPKPATVSFEAAASVPNAGRVALRALRDYGRVQPGQHVLINGVSGDVGTFAVQIAKALGAEVTAVCSAKSVETARAIGADHVVDYTREDFTKRRGKERQRYDLILGVNGYHSLLAYRRALRRGGTVVMVGASPERVLRALLQVLLLGPVLNRLGRKKVRLCAFKADPRDYPTLGALLESGQLVPQIDRTFPLAQTAEALRYMESGHPRGKIVITV